MVNTKIIADLPIELGIKRTYKGYFFLIAALELAITDQKNLLYMSKSIFPVIAARYGTTYSYTVVLNVTSEQQSTPVGIRQIVKNC